MSVKKYMGILAAFMGLNQGLWASCELKNEKDDASAAAKVAEPETKGWIGWGSQVLGNTYYYCTAVPETEKEKFPGLTVDMLAPLFGQEKNKLYPISPNDKTPADVIRKRAFLFTTSSQYKRNYYHGYWFIDAIDYGDVGHEFLGEQGFSPKGNYMSVANQKSPYEFLQELTDKKQTNFSLYKGTPWKGDDGRTRVIYQFHATPKGDYYITLTIGRFRVDDKEYLKNFQIKAEEKKLAS